MLIFSLLVAYSACVSRCANACEPTVSHDEYIYSNFQVEKHRSCDTREVRDEKTHCECCVIVLAWCELHVNNEMHHEHDTLSSVSVHALPLHLSTPNSGSETHQTISWSVKKRKKLFAATECKR